MEATLDRIRNITKTGMGLNSVSNQVKKIAEAAQKLSEGGIKKMSNLATALDRFSRLGDVKISANIGRQIGSIADAAIKLQAADLSKITLLADTLRPFSTMGTAHLTSYVNQLGKMPQVIRELNMADLDKFIANIKELNTALTPFANNMQKISNGFSAFPSRIQRLVTSTEKFNSTMSKANKVTAAVKSNGLWGFLNSAHSKYLALAGVFGKVSNTLGKFVDKSAEYNETVNLFSISMGKYAEEAYEYAKAVNSAIGIDKNEWMKNQGVYKQILDSFGVVEEKSYTMSKGLTQISYDIASFYNTTTAEALEKVRSGIAGEIEPLRALGITLDAATLQQIAYDHGIRQNINTMTQAQKSLLRYKAIMEAANNAVGDMARTVMEPANAMRVLSSRLNDFYREVGNLMIPLLMEMIPPAQAVVKALTTIIHELALLAGYKMPEIKESENEEALENITNEATAATQAVKELKNAALGIDELNVISQSSDSGIGNAFDLPIDVESYDKLFIDVSEEYKKRVNDLADEIVSKIEPIIEMFKAFSPFAEGFIGAIEGMVSAIAGIDGTNFYNLIDKITDWSRNNPETLEKMGDLAAKLTGVYTAITLFKKIGELKAVQGLFDLFGRLTDRTKNLKDAYDSKNKSLETQTKDTIADAAAAGIFVGAIGLVLGALYKLNGWLKENPLTPELNPEPIMASSAELMQIFDRDVSYADVRMAELTQSVTAGYDTMVGAMAGFTQSTETDFKTWADTLVTTAETLAGKLTEIWGEVEQDAKATVSRLEEQVNTLNKRTLRIETTWDEANQASQIASSTPSVFDSINQGATISNNDNLDGLTREEESRQFLLELDQQRKTNSTLDAIKEVVTGIPQAAKNIFGAIAGGMMAVPAFASGGYPDEGSLFIARERGAEMVGSIGGRTAVANNDQIVEAIQRGVYEAEMAARSQGGGDTYVYIDSDEVSSRIEKRKRESGMSIFAGGVVR